MNLRWTLFAVVFLFVLCTPGQCLFGDSTLQDYIDGFVDAAKFKLNGMLSLNESSVARIWNYFKLKYGRAYATYGEEKQRLVIFRDHLKFVLETNLQKLHTFQLALNEFADWTIEEFNEAKKGLSTTAELRRRVSDESNSENDDAIDRSLNHLYEQIYAQRRLKRSTIYRQHQKKISNKRGFRDWLWNLLFGNSTSDSNDSQTKSFDWRSKNVVGSIKDQLKCGCCYAFASAAVLESLYAIKRNSGSVIDLSPQQITDCSSNGNNGCNGGNFGPSLRYIAGHGNKLATWTSYPYAGTKQICKTSGINEINLGNIQYAAVPQGNEKVMAEALVTYGPIFIGLDADSKLFMFYKSGVLNIDNCPNRPQDMDHAMVVVGYGYDNSVKLPYWIIKNSWSQKWGENGYVRLVKDKGNMCGIASMAYYATLT